MKRYKLTNEQAAQVAANAVNASSPVGSGFLAFTGECLKADSFISEAVAGDIRLDYVDGRMVKLNLERKRDGWVVNVDREPRSDYQSWMRMYPTNDALVQSATTEAK